MKNIKCLVFLAFFNLLLPTAPNVFGQNLQLEWVKAIPSFGGETAIFSITLSADESSVYVAGAFKDSIRVNTIQDGLKTRYAGVGFGLFVAKVTPTGDIDWLKTVVGNGSMSAASTGEARVCAISSDASDNLYISGSYRGTADFDPGSGTALESTAASNNNNGFILKLDKNGAFAWVRTFPGDNNSAPAIKVDKKEGAVYVTGDFMGEVDFNPKGKGQILTQIGTGRQSTFVVKYDTAGNFVWVKQMGDKKGTNVGFNLEVDDHSVFVTGLFSDSSDYNPGLGVAPLYSSAAPAPNIFVLKLDKEGNYIWAKAIGSVSLNGQGAKAFSIATNSKGHALTTGYFQTIGNFDPAKIAPVFYAHPNTTGFISNLDSSGNYAWARVFDRSASAVPGTDYGSDILTDREDAVFTVGAFKGESYMDPDPKNINRTVFSSGKSDRDGFILKLDKNGNYEWAKHFFSETVTIDSIPRYGKSYIHTAKLTKSNHLYVGGYFGGVTNFNPEDSAFILQSTGQLRDAFIAKFSCWDTSSSVVSIDSCSQDFFYLGKRFDQSGDYKVITPNHFGCDSIIHLQLVLHPIPNPHINVNNFTLGVSGDYNTYQWILNEEPIIGATNKTYGVKENGAFRVFVTTEKGCSDTSDVYIVDNYTTGIQLNNGSEEKIIISPNPARDLIRISTSSSQIHHVLITDLQGRTIIQSENTKTIAVNSLAPGIYFLKIMNKEGGFIKTFKISIVR